MKRSQIGCAVLLMTPVFAVPLVCIILSDGIHVLKSATSPDGSWSVELRCDNNRGKGVIVSKDSAGRVREEIVLDWFDDPIDVESGHEDVFCNLEEGGAGDGSRLTDSNWRENYVVLKKPR